MTDPQQRYKYGTMLLWAGVLVWAPYFAQRALGASPSLWIYLPFHLAGVLGGGRMRTSANRQLGKPAAQHSGHKRMARYLVIASFLIWIPYYALKLTGRPVELAPFLNVHLIGMLGGTGIMVVGGAIQYVRTRRRG